MRNELEIVRHSKLSHVNMFVVAMEYRTPHLHRDFELFLILEGHLTLLSKGNSYTALPGEMLLINPNQPHELLSQGVIGATLLCLQVSPRFFNEMMPGIADIFFDEVRLFDHTHGNWFSGLTRLLIEMATAYMRCAKHYELFCASRLDELFYQLLSHLPHHSLSAAEQNSLQRNTERIIRLLDFVDANYMRKISLQNFAEMEGLSLNHLSFFIKENLNQTFQEYVANVRFNQACKLLLADNKRLIDVCMESGFSDPRYLAKAFIRRTGMTPNEYRHKYTGGEKDRYNRSLHSSQIFYSDEQVMRILDYICNQL